MPPKKEFFTCSKVLALMMILCFILHHTLRANMSIAIVDMTVKNTSNATLEEGRFAWNEEQKNDILGCLFWGYILTALPGGRLSEIFGTKIVLGTAMLLSALLTLLIPIACYYGYFCVIVIRVSLGITLGVTWPSVQPMATKWAAATDRAKFMSHMTASSFGITLTLFFGGYLIAYFKWPSIFYFTGGIVLGWCLAWFHLVYDSPEEHPRMKEEEKEYFRKNIRQSVEATSKSKTLWLKILSSMPVWAIIVANICWTFGFYILMNHLPSYMHDVLEYDIKENGVLSSLPHLGRYVTSVISSIIADRLLKSEKLSTGAVRNLFTSISFIGITLLMLIQSFWGSDRLVSIFVFILSFSFMGIAVPGYLTNALDISPAYSGTIFGMHVMLGALGGYVLSTIIVTALTKTYQNFQHWRYVFWIIAGVQVFGLSFCLMFTSGELQNWNPEYYDVVEFHEASKTKFKETDSHSAEEKL